MKVRRISDPFVRNYRMRIMHVSDNHGSFLRLPGRYDVVVATGDFCPNTQDLSRGNRNLEAAFQLQWLRQSFPTIKAWLQGNPFIFIPGNHDFLAPETIEFELRCAGIKARNASNLLVTHEGVNFYGFPYVPPIDGSWNYERDLPEMQAEADKMVAVLNSTYVDVLMCHCPPYQCLDLTYGNINIGSTVLANALDYKISEEMMPTTYLCGHCHASHGLTTRNGVLVSNAATTYQIIQV